MLPLNMVITSAGLDALVDAENGITDPIEVTEIGLSAAAVDAAPTLIALPGEFKRLAGVSGESVAANLIHMTAQDTSDDVYDLRSIALYLADGTLFAAYGQADPIFRKVSIASFLLAFDLAFNGDIAGSIVFGDASFLYPPATETEKGVAEIGTQAEVDAGLDDTRIVTPLKLKVLLDATVAGINAVLDAFDAAMDAALAAFSARTITGGGLVTGGGDLTADRVLTVTPATGADIVSGDNTKAVTGAAIAGVPQSFGSSVLGLGGALTKMGTVSVSWPGGGSVTFPVAFPNACDRVLLTPLGSVDPGDENDEPWWESGRTAGGFNVSVGGDGGTVSFAWVAYGH